jgi:hypothetical protein
MIKRISTLPSLGAANDPLTNRPDLISGVADVDLMELSISGIPLATFDSGGAEEGVFSISGWASIKTTIANFAAMIFERIRDHVYEYVMEKFLSDVDSGGGTYEATGEYMIVKDPDGITANDRYIPLYKKN